MEQTQKKQQAEQEERFKITDDNKACWALKEIKKCKEEIEQKKELAESQIYQVKKWLEDETSKLKDSIEYFESILHEYALELKKKDKDLKTYSLPFGKLQFRQQRKKWNYEDDELLKSLENAGFDEESGLIKVDKKVVKKKLKSIIKEDNSPYQIIKDGKVINTETGEIIKGVAVKERDEKFMIKVD